MPTAPQKASAITPICQRLLLSDPSLTRKLPTSLSLADRRPSLRTPQRSIWPWCACVCVCLCTNTSVLSACVLTESVIHIFSQFADFWLNFASTSQLVIGAVAPSVWLALPGFRSFHRNSAWILETTANWIVKGSSGVRWIIMEAEYSKVAFFFSFPHKSEVKLHSLLALD